MKFLSILVAVTVFSLAVPALAQPAEFDGYPCQTADCSGHRAGYDWAAQQGITDSNHCTGKSQSFIEGCQAYADGGSGDVNYDFGQEDEE